MGSYYGILLSSIGAEEILGYSLKDIVIFILALIVLVKAKESFDEWRNKKKQESYEEIDGETELKNRVNNDQDRLKVLENQTLAITRGVTEILRTDLMESHDKYMSRKPFPYITKYERLIHITMYDAYTALTTDPVIEGFHKELLELTVYDEEPPSNDIGDIQI